MDLEHPDITSACRTGCPSWMAEENEDCEENRKAYIEDNTHYLIKWLELGHPDVLEEFIEFSAQACPVSYRDWLN